jgi:hypothetical protein
MTDLFLTPTPDSAVTLVEGETEEGVEFVDAWVLGTLEVLDAGRIYVTNEVAGEVERAALNDGLTVVRNG